MWGLSVDQGESVQVTESGDVQLTVGVSGVSYAPETVTWASSDTAVATVDSDGLVSGVASGAAIITATSTVNTNVSADCLITVGDAVTLAVVTDTHVDATSDGDAEADNAGTNNPYWQSSQRLSRFVLDMDELRPDVIVHNGDMWETADQPDRNLWAPIWANRPEITTLQNVGNHDGQNAEGYQGVATFLGYDGLSKNAGSYYNQSYAFTNGSAAARVVMLDGNIRSDGVIQGSLTGYFEQPLANWLEARLVETTESVALVFCHYNIDSTRHMSAADEARFGGVVTAALTETPGRTIRWLSGHGHNSYPFRYAAIGDAVSQELPALAYDFFGVLAYTVLKVFPGGRVDSVLIRRSVTAVGDQLVFGPRVYEIANPA